MNQEVRDEVMQISIYALVGSPVEETIRLPRMIKGRKVSILIDSGSTHSFIDEQLAQLINCKMLQAKPILVTVAGGGNLVSKAVCNPLVWRMQDLEFQFQQRVLKLGESDMILGVDWLRQFSPVLFDFVKGSITFHHEGTEIKLQNEAINEEFQMMIGNGKNGEFKKQPNGIVAQIKEVEFGNEIPENSVKMKETKEIEDNPVKMKEIKEIETRFDKEAYGAVGQLCFLIENNKREIPGKITEMIEFFPKVFEELNGLPPPISHEHNIPVTDGVQPFKTRPYIHPFVKKIEIKRLVLEMRKYKLNQQLKENLSQAMAKIKLYADKNRAARSFETPCQLYYFPRTNSHYRQPGKAPYGLTLPAFQPWG
ncbi:Hypothetical predicted protein [Olea europaea subsp. europaea]|uniref:Peptidase A2 domain-containing protein n=2 Tax=Olea europaea subsp. europaea TaxID=158383 RepID=A0A8S0Q362_OLEEU|nr:Hypothetical predicted protein [Olea europaea subsp. europaea]